MPKFKIKFAVLQHCGLTYIQALSTRDAMMLEAIDYLDFKIKIIASDEEAALRSVTKHVAGLYGDGGCYTIIHQPYLVT